MKILLLSLGTRGDVEPFLAIGEICKEKGHHVMCAFPEQFKHLADDANIKCIALTPKFINLVESEDGKTAMGGKVSTVKKIGALIRLYRQSYTVTKELLHQQHNIIEKEKPDKIIYSHKATYPIIWGINNPEKSILVSPIPCITHYVKNHPTIGFNRNYGTFFNKLTYWLSNFGLLQNVLSTTKEFRKSPKITGKQIKKEILTRKMIYTVSPSIFPRPDYWPENAKVLGYHERSNVVNWQADERLHQFIANHDKILFITFGSMINPEPAETTKIIVDILEQHHIPAIINTASGGLIEPVEYDTDIIHFVPHIHYDWVFPKMYGIIHHGGSGTTHIALNHGCTCMIIPHILDQYVWNDLISDLGVGPKGIAINKITKQTLEPKILDLFQNDSYKKKALQLSEEMKKEDFREKLYKTITE
jgi:UDP:flavonoid glycosyltransferase YjiC (YdhE family)